MPIGKLLEWIVNANVSNTRRCFEAAFWDTLGGEFKVDRASADARLTAGCLRVTVAM